MGNFLTQLLGGQQAPAPQTEIPAQQTYSKALEARARANGFRSAAEMVAWSRQRTQQSGGTVPKGKGTVSDGLNGASMLYPPNILNYILGKWQGAVPRD